MLTHDKITEYDEKRIINRLIYNYLKENRPSRTTTHGKKLYDKCVNAMNPDKRKTTSKTRRKENGFEWNVLDLYRKVRNEKSIQKEVDRLMKDWTPNINRIQGPHQEEVERQHKEFESALRKQRNKTQRSKSRLK